MEALHSLIGALSLPDTAARAFLPFVALVGIWVAWSDMARMKIPNMAVGALVVVYLVVGPLVLPLGFWSWQWLHLALVLIVGFALNMGGVVGAGDAKFAAAAAPFVVASDVGLLFYLLAAILLAAFATHRLARRLPSIRARTPGWVSWEARKFPMGLALGPALVFYIALCAV